MQVANGRRWVPSWPTVIIAVGVLVAAMFVVWKAALDDDSPPASAPLSASSMPATLGQIRDLLASDEPAAVSVLGDSTGDGNNEWVALWAQDLAKTHSVTYHGWDDKHLAWMEPITYSTGRAAVVIWNMSASGRTAAYPATLLEKGQPSRPDLVIYSFGHNNAPTTIGPEMKTTMSAVTKKWDDVIPTVVILQNPSLGQRGIRQAKTVELLRSTVAPGLGVPTIDVYAAFEQAGALQQYLVDGLHPNNKGSRLWADTVTAALLE